MKSVSFKKFSPTFITIIALVIFLWYLIANANAYQDLFQFDPFWLLSLVILTLGLVLLMGLLIINSTES